MGRSAGVTNLGRRPFRSEVMPVWVGMRLFDVPVYRVSPERWRQEQADREARLFGRMQAAIDLPLTEEQKWRTRHLLHDEHGGYQFNQIMGWVQVVWDGPGPVVKCYCARVETRRMSRAFRQRRFQDVGKIAEVWFGRDVTSTQIMAEIRTELIRETRGSGMLGRRFLDLETFDNLAAVLDMRRLLGLDTGR